MKTKIVIKTAIALFLAGSWSGCGLFKAYETVLTGSNSDLRQIRAQSDLMQKLMKEPDTTDWYNQREQIAQALGDRVYDKEFGRVFDSLTIALASMGARVNNIERASGFISASGQLLPPDTEAQIRKEGLVEYCRLKGYDPALLKPGQYGMNPDVGMSRYSSALTVSLVRQSATQTKVKLRFTGVYYPKTVEEYYKAVWPQLEKQIFLDKNLDEQTPASSPTK